MARKLEVYKCEVCGNIVEVLHGGAGELVCCNRPMILMEENTVDAATEKHVPVMTEENKVKVGEVAHPMEDKHYIEWIEVIMEDGRVYRKFLSPGDGPEAVFDGSGPGYARSYCNLHGLWKS